jgi:hypothetical protein
MRRWVPLLVCFFLLMSGVCTYNCLAEIEHQCCHKTTPVVSQQSHPAVDAIHVVPALPEIGFVFSSRTSTLFEGLQSTATLHTRFLPSLILRL